MTPAPTTTANLKPAYPTGFPAVKPAFCRAESQTSLPAESVPLIDLYSGSEDVESSRDALKREIIRGLKGSDRIMVPGRENDPEDLKFAYKRTLPTTILYDEKGLILYDKLTFAPEYYLFNAELEILKQYGSEIALRIFGHQTQPTSSLVGSCDSEIHRKNRIPFDDQGHAPDGSPHIKREDPKGKVVKEKWGDDRVGKHNGGVNAEEGMDAVRCTSVGSLVELGAGSLRKTTHLIRALANLPNSGRGPSVNYYALDLDKSELVRTLEELRLQECTTKDQGQWTVLDGKVALHGMWSTYDAGLDFIGRGGLSNGRNEEEGQRCLMWLGSSIGNFDRKSAADFLAKTASSSLRAGDTMLISIDRRNKPTDVALAYNDPAGLTRDFIMNGIDNADGILGGGVLDRSKFEYYDRYNSREGRHESYYRSKVAQEIHLPGEDKPIFLDEDELLHMECSYKYSEREALDIFDYAGLRVIQKWTDKASRYDVWLVERPQFHFSNSKPSTFVSEGPRVHAEGADRRTDDGWANSGVDHRAQVAPRMGLPSLDDWDNLWKAWDTVTLTMIPREMLHEKPIDLRHLCLFYIGHIPAFLDIHVSTYLEEPHTNERFSSIFERGIDPHVDDQTKCNPHSVVPARLEDWPTLEEILEYKDRVAARVRKIYANIASGKVMLNRRLARMLWMTHEHKALHLETLLYMLSQSPKTLHPKGFAAPDWPTLARGWETAFDRQGGTKALEQLVNFDAGTVILGHDDDDSQDFDIIAKEPSADVDDLNKQLGSPEFGWDNEHPQRAVETGAFSIMVAPISNSQYAEFLLATGSRDIPQSWIDLTDVEEGMNEFHVRTVYGPVSMKVAKHWPVQASGNQLSAYAKWRGGRLPTQAELRRFLDSPPEVILLDIAPTDQSTAQIGTDGAGDLELKPPVRGSAAKYVPREQQSEEDLKWMREALKMAEEAAANNEVPVGGVFVRNGEVIAKGRNRTNELMNATRHAELEAIDHILSVLPPASGNFALNPHSCPAGDNPFKDTTLYVTIEPCIMCGSALRQIGIGRVVFGAGNERFGGNGSVIGLHDDDALISSPSYEAVGGYLRDEAIMVLRKFYITENTNAPNPLSKARRVLKTEIQPPGVSMHGPSVAPSKSGTGNPASARRKLENPSQARAAPCANVGFRNWHPVPAQLPRFDLDGTLLPGHNGGVWEWTSTPFMDYEGFRPSALYPGYSADFFDGKHSVVLGGSWATVPWIAGRRSVCNSYQAAYPYIFGGARVVFDRAA
ncbi:hypothetical protein IE53DRAFT_317214 [Violaceomyces palustris]|uniref:Uncharacterized protein n=1 Tax=Violaceomyces palustris TaxID=1673888 RepID=A0ACD0NVB0_9BASI|nr:hypothetical protein IE53DRAFT_317214 [Violaceomyces palustris]